MQLLQQLAGTDDWSIFSGHTRKTIDDLTTFNENVEHLFREWESAKGPLRKEIKSQIRQKLLNEVGCIPYLSLEENVVEFRRNIASLRIRLKQNQIHYENEVAKIKQNNENLSVQLHTMWKKEREKWRGMVRRLVATQALSDCGDVTAETERFDEIKQFCNTREIKDENSIIFFQQQEIERLRFELSEWKRQHQNQPDDQQQNDAENTREIIMKKTITDLSESLCHLKRDYIDLKTAFDPSTFQSIMENTEKQTTAILRTYRGDLEKMTLKYREMASLKRRYFNEVQELKGNIRVYARSRPILPIDGKDQKSVVTFLGDNTMDVVDHEGDRAAQRFTFDKVFSTESTQAMVYKDVSPFIESVMDGYNCCIFAYGQTGSGKTFTMQGNEDNPGVNIRALQHLFTIAECRKPDFKYEIKVEMMEIYNEQIRDLLVSTNPNVTSDYVGNNMSYKVRHGKQGVFVENLSSHLVESKKDVLKLMEMGMKNRSVGCTKSNEESSRSHMVLTVSVMGTNAAAKVTYSGKLNLIDLAGSERVKKSGVDGAAMKEAQNINKSLSALGDVIAALSKKAKHVPFRNSTLTHLLQSSLGGNSKTLMFTNISPAQMHYGETVNALKFARRAKTVELGPTRKSVKFHSDLDRARASGASDSSRVSRSSVMSDGIAAISNVRATRGVKKGPAKRRRATATSVSVRNKKR